MCKVQNCSIINLQQHFKKAGELMQKYNCKNCGAQLYWDSNANCLKCEYCDSEYQVSDFQFETQENPTPSQPTPETADEHAKATDDSDSLELVVYKCSHCSAEIITAKSTIATTCAYCGRAISMTDKLVDDFKPDAVIPFLIPETKAKELYKQYIHSSFLTPKTFASESVIKKIKGIFVPFWLHSFKNTTNAVIYCENMTSHRRGNDKIIDHHMYHVSIDATGTFTDIPTDALKNLDNTLMDAIEPFDYTKLQPFNPAYMAGFYAEEYNEDENQTLTRAKERATQTMLSNAQTEAGIFAVKSIYSSQEQISNTISKYAMLPVWLLNVEYKGKDYLFAINAETGKIAGSLPICKKKLALTTLISLLGSYILLTIVKFFLLSGGVL